MTNGNVRDSDAGSAPARAPQGRPGAPPPQRGSGLFKGCLVVLVLLGALSLLAVFGLAGLVVVAGLTQAGGVESGVRLEEVTVGGEPGAPKVVCVSVEGLIYGVSAPARELSPVALAAAQLRRAAEDPEVRGVILYVNSSGGEITGSDILHQEVRRFRDSAGNRPVVACMLDMAASGAYYVSVAADRIIAHPTTITGSIGVMMPLFTVTGLMEKVGVRSESITTGEFKDIGSPFVQKDEEQKRKEREILEAIIGEMYDRFVSVVAEGRHLEVERVRELADGRIFTSKQALEHGLIDEIGYERDAVNAMKKLAGVTKVHLVRYRRRFSFGDVFTAFARGPQVTFAVAPPAALRGTARPMFLWVPPAGGATPLEP